MNSRASIVLKEIAKYCETNLASFFGVVFGSVSAGRMSDHSDIDVTVFADQFSDEQSGELTGIFLSKCEALGISTRAQIPHRLYTLTSYDRLRKAIRLGGLERGPSGCVVVPPRLETHEFYTSEKMLMRFAFNAMTTQHQVFCSHGNDYGRFRTAAITALLRLIVHLRKADSFSLDELVESTVSEPHGVRREGRFLGYKAWDIIQRSLRESYEPVTDTLIQRGLLKKSESGFKVSSSEWWTDFDGNATTDEAT